MNPNIYWLPATLALIVLSIGTFAHVQLTNVVLSTTNPTCAVATLPNITANAAYVYDVKTGTTLFSKNEDTQLPLASLTKIATAFVASENLDSSAQISVTENALSPEGDSGLFAGEKWDVQDLLAFTLMTSSNDGARALALAAGDNSIEKFVERMNALAKQAGASQTFFLNETGLDVSSTTAGAYGSARDVALLLTYAYGKNPDALVGSTQSANVYTSLSGFKHTAEHTSSVAGTLPGELVVKTGFTDLAGGNLAVLAEVLPGRPVAIVVLGATKETRDTEVATLAEAARQLLKRDTLCKKM